MKPIDWDDDLRELEAAGFVRDGFFASDLYLSVRISQNNVDRSVDTVARRTLDDQQRIEVL